MLSVRRSRPGDHRDLGGRLFAEPGPVRHRGRVPAEPATCPDCGRTFRTPGILRNHIRQLDEEDGPTG